MKILILSSIHPKLSHEKASSKILAELLKNIALFGHQVSWATLCCPKQLDKETELGLGNLDIHHFGDFSDEVELEYSNPSKFLHRFRTLRRCLIPFTNDDFPRFYNPKETLNRLKKYNADVLVLFWDTWFENLLPYIKGVPIIGYWGKPKHAAPMACLKSGLGGNKIRRWLLYRLCKHQQKRHLQRARYLTRLSNICAIDVAEYKSNGISCQYISNTWPDAFGNSWQEKRMAAEKSRSKFSILANIGNLSASGNTFGLTFLANKVLPFLDSYLNGIDWEINICGQGQFLPAAVSRLEKLLKHPRINIKGFVPDIDNEMLSNQVFLLLNNAGIYTGGYTRVIYTFSSGGCLIAHRKLAQSMPEVKHGINALLGGQEEEIAKLVAQVARNPNLRSQIGRNARKTYEQEYHPEIVAKKIIDLAQSSLV